jgi:outer membrane protein TolC
MNPLRFRILLSGVCLICSSVCLLGQPLVTLDTPSKGFLTPGKFNKIMLRYHPMAKQAEFKSQRGPAKVRKARGRFDPKIFSDLDAKTFKGSNYYRIQETGLKIPTWFGIDLKFYREQNRGQFLNNERNVPSEGLYGVGVELPIGQGLFTDKRRTALNKAKVMRQVQVNKRHQLLMKLLSKGFQDYWKWATLHQQRDLMRQAEATANQRFQDIKQSFRGGVRTAIDTVEAMSQVQQFRVRKNALNGRLKQQRAKLSTYLWDEQQEPRQITNDLKPPSLTTFSIQTMENLYQKAHQMDSVNDQHPALTQYRNKLELLSLENRWRKEQFKPKLDLKYHALQNAGNAVNLENQAIRDDIKWGIGFQFPLFLRKERGSLQLNKLKQQSTQLEFKQQQLNMQRKLEGAQQRLKELLALIKTNRKNLQNFKRLLEAERTLFDNGESTLLKINLRELKYLKAQQKQVKYLGQFFKLYSLLRYRYTYQRNLAASQEGN